MALEVVLSASINSGCTAFTLLDITGSYDPVTNPTGYGAPNPATTDITAISLEVSCNYLAVSETIDLTAYLADLLGSGYSLTASALLNTGVYPDGYYEFTYTVTALGVDYVYIVRTSVQGTVECCVRRESLNQKYPICDYKDVQKAAIMFFLFASLNYAACCDNEDRFNEVLTELQTYCSGNGRLGTNSISESGCGCNN
jgi:hypothetical protein